MALSGTEMLRSNHVSDLDGRTIVVNPDGTTIAGGGTPAYQGTPGAAVPSKAIWVAGTDGTNLRGIATDAAGVVKTDIAGQDITLTTSSGALAGDGRKTVTTAGTAVALAASTACKWVCATALPSNTDKVAVGTSTVLAATGSSRGFVLAPGQAASFEAANLANVYVDSRVNGEGVAFAYGT